MQIGTWRRVCREKSLDEWLDHCCRVFPHAPREYFQCHLQQDIQSQPMEDAILVAGQVVESSWVLASTVRIINRDMYMGHQCIKIAGLAEVATLVSYRKQGLATRLIEAAIQLVQQQDISVICLKTRSQAEFYKKLGWKCMERCLVNIASDQVPASIPFMGYAIVTLDFKNAYHVEEMHRIYTAFASQFHGPFVRSLHYFTHWIPQRHEQHGIQAIGLWDQHQTRLISYMYALDKSDHVQVEEWVMDPVLDYKEALCLLHHCTPTPKTVRMALPLAEYFHLLSLPHDTLLVQDLEWCDPNPDLHALFMQFNKESALDSVEVRWSRRMTLCAGMCYYYPGGYCSIRLSEPLLKYRTRQDMINTLLHEMIHAYLFLTENDRDRQGHGPSFLYHAQRINSSAGTQITVYHSFHEEVDHYRLHVWQCNGPCQHQPPYYGLVKRSMNRPPQPADEWHARHQAMCGGTFIKISEPEKTESTIPVKAKGMKRIDEYFKKTEMTLVCPLCQQGFETEVQVDLHIDTCTTMTSLERLNNNNTV